MNSFIEYLNLHGGQFLDFAWPMLWQSSLLIVLVLAVDVSLARRIRASVRHALWLAVLVKLLLPPTLALPTGAAWWLFPAKPVVQVPAATRSYAVTYDNPMPAPVFEQESVVRPAELPSPPPPAPKLNRVGWTLLGCAAVSAALLAWLLCRWWQLLRKVRAGSAPAAFAAVLHQARDRAGLPPGIRLKLVEGNMSPAVCGLFRPVILLPRVLVEQLSSEQLHAVLLHESIHLRRKDIWVNCAQALLQIVYWWHPLVWVANARIRRVREEAVDDAVMLALAQEGDLYAATLLDVAKLAFTRPSMSLGIVGIMESRSALRQRVERLMDFHAPRKAGLTLVSLLGILAFSAVALPMGEGPARVEKAAETAPTVSLPPITAQNSNRPPVMVTAEFFQMPAESFKNLVSGLPPNQGHLSDNIWWSASPAEFASLHSHLEGLGFVPLSNPRIATPSGEPARFYTGNGTNGFWLDCTPVARGTTVDLTVQGRVINENFSAFLADEFRTNPSANISRIAVRLKYTDDLAASNFVVIIGVQVLTNAAPRLGADPAIESSSKTLATYTGVLTDPNFRTALRALEQRTETEELGEPKIAVISGRQVQMRRENVAENYPARSFSPNQLDTATLIQEGKVLYEMGKLGEAEVKLKTALAQDPGNATAKYYLNLIQNARPEIVPPGRLANTNSLRFTSTSRQAINAKLDKIHLDNVMYDGLPLSEVLKQLAEQCKLRDPEHKGINFLINNNPELSGTTQPDIGSSLIKIPGLSDVRLADVLDAIVLVSDHPLKYSIQDFGVMFYAKDLASPPAFTRTFRADPNTFYSGLENVGAQSFGAVQNSGGGAGKGQNNGAVVGVVNAFPGAGGVRNSGSSGGGNAGGGGGQGGSGSLLNNPAATGGDPQHTPESVLTSPGRQAIVSKLDHIHLPKVSFDRLRLSEVARQLTEAAKQYDPEKIGVHFTTTTNAVFREWDEINSVVIHIPSLTDVRLADALDAIVLVAGKPIKYSVRDDGIIFSAKEETVGTNRLFMRTFRVDPNTFYSGLENVTAEAFSHTLKSAGDSNGQLKNIGVGIDDFSPGNGSSSRAYITKQTSTTTPSALARAFFTTLGVNLSSPPGKSVFFNDKLGVLFVKATESDLDTIERALQVLNTVPPQVQIKARFYALPKGTLDFDKYLNAPNFVDGKTMGILTSQKASEAMQAAAASKDSEILGEPEITVISGRQVQMKTVEMMTVVTNLQFPEEPIDPMDASGSSDPSGSSFAIQTKSVETGPVVDIVPYVLADGYTINLAVIPSVTEFLGYQQVQLPHVPGSMSTSITSPQPPAIAPIIRNQNLVGTANVWDGQTLVLRMEDRGFHKTAKIEMPKGTPPAQLIDRDLIIFITATVVDPAGSRVHSDDELPFSKDSTPSQPASPSQPSPIQSY